MSKLNFDATTVAPQQPIDAIPAGWYKAAMSESEMKPTSDGTGTRLATEFTILEGSFKGRKVFDGFNLENKNPQTVEIAQQQLSALCHAAGVLRVTDSSQLHNIPVGIKVSLDAKRTVDALNNEIDPKTKQAYVEGAPSTKTYDAQNRIKAYKNANEVTTEASMPAVASKSGAPAPAWAINKPIVPSATVSAPAGVPPWEQPKSTQVAASTPAATSAETTSATKTPRGPKKKVAAVAEAPKPERKFFVYIDDKNMPLQTEKEIVANFAKGMPLDTPLLLEADLDSGDWKDAAQYQIGDHVPTKEAPAASNVPPWERK